MDQDSKLLELLSIFHYAFAALTAVGACYPVIVLILGIFLLFPNSHSTSGPPQIFALMLIIGSAISILAGWASAICLFLAGRYLSKRTHRLFCLIIAGISCMNAPIGTALGIFTIIVLMRQSVQDLFDG